VDERVRVTVNEERVSLVQNGSQTYGSSVHMMITAAELSSCIIVTG